MFISSNKTYKLNQENIDFLFNMNTSERYKFKLRGLIKTKIEHLDFKNLNDKRILISFSICIALISLSHPAFAAGTGLEWADKIGNTFLHYAQCIGKWVCLLKAILTLIQSVAQDTLSRCWRNVIGYAIAALAIQIIPDIFFSLK